MAWPGACASTAQHTRRGSLSTGLFHEFVHPRRPCRRSSHRARFHPRHGTTRRHAHQPREQHATGWSAVRVASPRTFIAVLPLRLVFAHVSKHRPVVHGVEAPWFPPSHRTTLLTFFLRSRDHDPVRSCSKLTGERSYLPDSYDLASWRGCRCTGVAGEKRSNGSIDRRRVSLDVSRLKEMGNCRGVSSQPRIEANEAAIAFRAASWRPDTWLVAYTRPRNVTGILTVARDRTC